MPDVTRRRLLAAGAAGVGAALVPTGWTAFARTNSAAPPEVLAADDLALWYDEPAGTEWLRALPIGNGRLGAMVFGNVDTERLQLNEDTVWAGGPYDSANTRGAANLAEIRRRVFADQWTSAQDLINQTMMGTPGGQLAYQTVGNLRLAFGTSGGATQYRRDARPHHRGRHHDVRAERSAPPARGVRERAGSGDRRPADRRPGQRDLLQRHLRQPATHDDVQPGQFHDRPRRDLRQMEGVTGSVRFLALAQAIVTGGTVTSSGGTLRVSGATSVTLLVSIGSSYVNFRTVNGDYQGIARSRLSAARAVGADQLRSRHVADYQALFGRVTIDLGRTSAADQPTDVRIAQHASRQRPAVLRAALPVRPLPADLLVAAGHPAGQPAGHLERLDESTVGLEVHHQRQPADELLAGRHHQPGGVLPAGLRDDQGSGGERRPHRAGAVRRRRLGHAPQHRRLAGHVGGRRGAVGHVADRRRVAQPR